MPTTSIRLFRNCNRGDGSNRFYWTYQRGFGRAVALGLLAGALCFSAKLSAQSLPNPKSWHLLIEPSFMHPEVSFPIPGAQRTVFVPGYIRESGSAANSGADSDTDLAYFTKAQYDQIHLGFEEFLDKSRANSSDKKVTAKFIRNNKQVIEYAVFQSQSPLMASAVLSPDFVSKFKDILGKKLIVAIPNRYTLFVFPADTSDYRDYAGVVLEAYRESSFPVSVEAFEVSKEGLRAVGVYEQ